MNQRVHGEVKRDRKGVPIWRTRASRSGPGAPPSTSSSQPCCPREMKTPLQTSLAAAAALADPAGASSWPSFGWLRVHTGCAHDPREKFVYPAGCQIYQATNEPQYADRQTDRETRSLSRVQLQEPPLCECLMLRNAPDIREPLVPSSPPSFLILLIGNWHCTRGRSRGVPH